MTEPELHKALKPIAWLLGTWRGTGKGSYPTAEPFTYGEEARFWHLGRPFILYTQRTWSLRDESPMHSEMGFWRPTKEGTIELVLAHGFGITEIAEGAAAGSRIELKSTSLVSTATAKHVEALARVYELRGNVLVYRIDMQFKDHPLQPHLAAELNKID